MKLSRFIEMVQQQLNVTEVNGLHSFKEDLGADSLDMVELVTAIEDELGIDLPDSLGLEEEDRVSIFYSEILRVLHYKSIRYHQLTEEECTVGHVKFDGKELVSRGQCRWCNNCVQWIRPKNFNAECNPASHREDKP